MKILTVIGARPQFVKAAAVSRKIKEQSTLSEIIVHTGQHYDENMSEVFFREMDIPKPNFNLQINNSSHGAMTGKMIEGLEEIMLREKPDTILIYGDTNSTLAGAIAASKIHIPIAHVEAGLRSFNMRMPEEVNRILADRLSSYLFCPTQQAISNLKNEGYDNIPSKIIFSGDVMFDAALYYTDKSKETSKILSRLNIAAGEFILTTIHRAENTDSIENLQSIFKALRILAKDSTIVLPLHPRTSKFIQNHQIDTSNIIIIEPVGYFDMLQLIQNAHLVITDSGGLQKEAYFFQKPCITTREQTEWVELVDNGYNILTGADADKIIAGYNTMKGKSISLDKNLYGQGNAAEGIAKFLADVK
ncbi:UDP-GlcNAc3NAcA epimerase [Chitinophaga skermanii]|uniref:UDP-GlcNAc3NAcA epimerase n=1 Tax=Chitinophaga skermanii TaxID=331697 RepID=A0A327R467_9BACT|nr:UDP-N-acetylglucosamine 2-epimerase (non-hydrolyzing) [Chitinophaga skermanii]RAJ10523.1 UDP-GlcNAc3NAcA epimerase [Chitinophaga skermanii]